MSSATMLSGKFCYIIVPGNPIETSIGIVVFGEDGYYPSTYNDRRNMNEVRELVDLLNGRLGLDRAIVDSMLAGSMFGWNVPAARAARERFAEKGGAE